MTDEPEVDKAREEERAGMEAERMKESFMRSTPHHPMGRNKFCARCCLPFSAPIHNGGIYG